MVPPEQDCLLEENFVMQLSFFSKSSLQREAPGQAMHLLCSRRQLQHPKGIDNEADRPSSSMGGDALHCRASPQG